MSNKVKYGLKNVYFAKATIDPDDNTATYGTPKKWPGAVSLSLDAEGGTNKFRADNIDYYISQSNNGYEGDFESALVPESFRKDILGDVTTSDGVLIEDVNAKTVYFALMFQFEGDATNTRHVMYKCSATRPSVSGQTTEEEVEPQTETLTITAGAIHNSAIDMDVVKARCDQEATPYETWFDAVYQASSISA